ncbi:MAG: DUF6240 domain-containing protein [Lachnospiraceae bacterium]|nr:DUF6240 domain-containing protein [Lachnospiraceae bacterium]
MGMRSCICEGTEQIRHAGTEFGMKISFEQLENIEQSRGRQTGRGISGKASNAYTVFSEKSAAYESDKSGKSVYGFKPEGHEERKDLSDRLAEAENYDANTAHRYMAVMSNTMSEDDFSELVKDGYDPGKMPVGEAVTSLDRIKVVLAKSGKVVKGFNDDIDVDVAKEVTGSTTMANSIANAGKTARSISKTDISEKEVLSKDMPDKGMTNKEITYKNIYDKSAADTPNTINQADKKDIAEALKNADLPESEWNLREVEKALDKVREIEPLSQSTVLYMTKNELEPTIQNVFEAQYSAGSVLPTNTGKYFEADNTGYMVTATNAEDLSGIQDQINAIIKKSGFLINDDTVKDAHWLVQNGVPLTEVTFQLYEDMKSVVFPLDESVVLSEITDAMSNGYKATDAYLIKNYRTVKSERQLEETRLKMTHEANNSMLEGDYFLDTSELENKVDNLKIKENNYYKAVFGDSPKRNLNVKQSAALYEKTLNTVNDVKQMPVELIGKLDTNEKVTLESIERAGRPLKEKYDAANKTYETVGTDVREDLGDDIQKAFRNVDKLLEDIGYEITSDNQRAVRILGYNSMEITPENIEKVRSLDIQVRGIIEKMTPATTINIIKNRMNPLEMSLDEISDVVTKNNNDGSTGSEGYAKFLLQLEKNNEITDEEATSYIGIYRLFHAIEKSDGAVIGSLLNADRDLTVKNLLGEIRNKRRQGKVDYTLDKDFAGVDETEKEEDFKIDVQINAAFNQDYLRHASKEVYEKLDANVLHNSNITEDTTVYELLDILREASIDDAELGKLEFERVLEDLKKASDADNRIYQLLEYFDVDITADNVNAVNEMIKDRMNAYADMYKKAIFKEKQLLEEKVRQVHEAFEEEDTEQKVKGAYEEFAEAAEEVLANEEIEAVSFKELRAIQKMHKRLSVSRQLAQSENYEVPIFMDGQLTTMNLKIVHGFLKSRVDISMECESLGKVNAAFTIKDNSVEGAIAIDYREAFGIWYDIGEAVRERLEEENFEVLNVGVMFENKLTDKIFDETIIGNENFRADSVELYKVAKSFISVITSLDRNVRT